MVEKLALLGRVAREVATAKHITIILWTILAAIAGIFAPLVSKVTSVSVSPPRGSPSAEANKAFYHHFPDVGLSCDFALLLKSRFSLLPNSIIDIAEVEDYSNALFTELKESLGEELLGYSSYHTLVKLLGLPEGIVKKKLVSPNGEAALISWQVKGDPTKPLARQRGLEAQDLVSRTCKEKFGADSGIECLLSSVPMTITAAVVTGQKVMETMDMVSLPIAVFVCGAVVRSMRLMIVPLLLLAVSLSVSFGFLYGLSHFTVIESTTPPLMMSLLIAMSFDYSLFICTRFREELNIQFHRAESLLADHGNPVTVTDIVMDTIEATFSTAGFTVLLSGVTLTASFCILILCPVGFVFSMGSGCAFALFVTNVAALTLPPALFAAFPSFFAQSRCDGVENQFQKCSEATWTFLAKSTTRFPWNVGVVAIVVGGTVMLASHATWNPGLHITASLKFNIPYHTELATATDDIAALFGKGTILPYKMLMAPRRIEDRILSPDGAGWQKCISIIEALVRNPNLTQTSADSFNFACFNNAVPVDWRFVNTCIGKSGGEWLSMKFVKFVMRFGMQRYTRWRFGAPMCRPTLGLVNHFVSEDNSATYGYISLKVDPLGPDGQEWVKEMRRSLRTLGEEYGFDLYLIGNAQESWDMIDQLYSWFPYMVINSLVVAFLLLGIAFRSVVLPLRTCVSILLTLGFVFGLAVSSYEGGCFDWTGVHGVSSDAGGIHFIIPFLAFSVVMGICLDYEIFLLARTVEICGESGQTRMAIEQSLVATGSIITSAGIIMVIAFGGLMFSSMLALNQLGFFLAFAAFYDTFVVRTIISPAMMDLLGDWHWWPGPLFHKTRAVSRKSLVKGMPASIYDRSIREWLSWDYRGLQGLPGA